MFGATTRYGRDRNYQLAFFPLHSNYNCTRAVLLAFDFPSVSLTLPEVGIANNKPRNRLRIFAQLLRGLGVELLGLCRRLGGSDGGTQTRWQFSSSIHAPVLTPESLILCRREHHHLGPAVRLHKHWVGLHNLLDGPKALGDLSTLKDLHGETSILSIIRILRVI